MLVALWKFVHDVKHLSLVEQSIEFLVSRILPLLLPNWILDSIDVLHAFWYNCVVEKSFNFIDVGHDRAPTNML